MTNYEPGTIVRADTPYAGDVLMVRTMTGIWFAPGGFDYHDPATVTNVRPVVVIDPDDTEQVVALAKACPNEWLFCQSDGTAHPSVVELLQDALRSLLPTPKPAEPTGLGAVVEDGWHVRWTRVEPGALTTTRNPWYPADSEAQPAEYADISVVRVLSEGVTP